MRIQSNLIRLGLGSLLILACGAVGLAQIVIRQPAMAAPPGTVEDPKNPGAKEPGTGTAQFSAIKLVEKSEYRQIINVAKDCIKDETWDDACTALQSILDNKEDFYVQVREKDSQGRESLRWISVKFEASNLLGSMKDEGLDVYEIRFGGKAKSMLDSAREKGDRDQLAEVAQRYLHTKAGMDASELLATDFLDRGQYFMAALRLEKLLAMNPERAKLSDLTLFKAVLAYRRAGDVKNADMAWRRLEPKLRENGGLRIGTEVVAVAKLQQFLDENHVVDSASPHDWPIVWGNITHSAQAKGSPPLLDQILWKRPTILDKDEISEDIGANAKRHLDEAIAKQKSLGNQPVMSGFSPIAVNRLLIYRSFQDIRAVRLTDEREDGINWKPGSFKWQSTLFEGSLSYTMENHKVRPSLETWLTDFNKLPAGFTSFLFENSLVGTLSTDHRYVYAIDDLCVPVPGNIFPFGWNQTNITQETKDLVMQNKLCAFDLQTGKFTWKLGDFKGTNKDDPFTDSHFLGAPISVGGKLWVLNEKSNGQPTGESELRLVCIDPNKLTGSTPQVLEPMQSLGLIQQAHRFTHDLTRRTNAVHLAYGEGILVCPTNAGEVLGVDLMSRSLAWSYPYRESAPQSVSMMPGQPGIGINFPGGRGNPQATMSIANWKSSPPVLVDGKVIFTAPDANSIHCINLRDGTPVWKKRQIPGDQFFAGVFAGKAIVVGQNSIRALRITDGSTLWYLSTGDLPSGQGVASKNIYYLPLSKGEILAVDLEKGQIKAHNRAKNPEPAPGNLVFHEGAVLSQTPTEIVAYPQLQARLDVANREVLDNPNDAEKLVVRGELHLADGQVQAAVDDFHKVLEKKPNPVTTKRAKDKLYEALTDLLLADFNAASLRYLDEYKDLCKVPENDKENQMRQARFFRIVGQGREAQGNLVEAFQMYREFGSLPINREQGIASLDDPMHKIPTNVWLRGRISNMMSHATPEQRAPLEAKIAQEWQLVSAKKDPDAIRSFVDMFDVPFIVGREARLELAEILMARNDKSAFLEAELALQQVRGSEYKSDSAIGARILAALAVLEEKKGTSEAMKLAASYYRELKRDFPNVAVREGKTGSDLFDELATDPRFLPYLEEAGPLWRNEKIAAREMQGINLANLQGFIFQPEGDLPAILKQQRLVLDPSNAANPILRLYDMATNEVRWTQSLGTVQTNFQVFQYLYQQGQANANFLPNARFRFYQVKGHLAVFQIGTMAYCLDLSTSKMLWQQNLVKALPNQPNMVVQQVTPDAEGNLELIVWNQFNGQRTRIPIGKVGAVQAAFVAIVGQEGLQVLDPLRGTILWRKVDVPASVHLFGDEQHLFMVDGADQGGVGTGQTMRAIDGAVLDVPDFGVAYSNRVRILGRRILAATPGRDHLTLRLYDIPTGKDIWSKKFDPKAVVTQTEDPNLTGVIDGEGNLVAIDVETGRVLVESNVVHGRVTLDDVKTVKSPLLLRDQERFYVALNRAVDSNKVAGGVVSNNFTSGLRCITVNGWFLAIHAQDGQKKVGDKTRTWKRGDFAWHTLVPLDNQMLVLEQFDNLPVILFSSRYNELINNGQGGNRWVSLTQSVRKDTGKMVYDPGAKASNSAAQYYACNIDVKAGTINLLGITSSVQHYLDDGRKVNVPGVPGGGGIVPADPNLPGVAGGGGPAFPGGLPRPIIMRPIAPIAPAPAPAPAPDR